MKASGAKLAAASMSILMQMAGCSTTRYVPAESQPATWQSAQETVRSLLSKGDKISGLIVSETGLAYRITRYSHGTVVGRRGRLIKVTRRLAFGDMTQVAIQQRTHLASDTSRVVVSLRGGEHLNLPVLKSKADTRSLAAALARLGNFLPDPNLAEPDLPPVRRDQTKPPAVPDAQLDAELDRAMRESGAPSQPPAPPSLLWSGEGRPTEEEQLEPMRLRLMPGFQYALLDDVEVQGGGFLFLGNGRGPDDVASSFMGSIEVDLLAELSIEANARLSKFKGSAISVNTPVFLSFGFPALVASKGKTTLDMLTVDLDFAFHFQLGWLELGPRIGGRFVKLDGSYRPIAAPPFSVETREGMVMIGVSLDATPFELPVSFLATVRGGLSPQGESDSQSMDARLEIRFLWDDLLGITLGYRYETLQLGKKGRSNGAFLSGSPFGERDDDYFEGTIHGPYVALFVQF